MSLDLHDFDAFFAEFHDGQSPFDWQRELLDRLLRTGRWPSSIVAPTGAGKSSVLHIHVFAQAIAAGSERLRLPRRLVHIVGRRALVDDMSVSALVLSSRLQQALDAEAPSVLGEVAHALRTAGEHHDLLPVTVLRGGVPPQRGWVDEPAACQIVCATPDMLGSRLLFRGYGSSAQARPREAGLLAYDSALVVDEAHLNRQLLETARRVAELATESPLAEQVPVLQVIETTATPSAAGAGDALGLNLAQPLGDERLEARMTRPKPLHRHPGLWLPGLTKAVERTEAVGRIVDLALGALDAESAHPVGIVVNRVDSAVAIWAALCAREGIDPERVALLVGPQRAWERGVRQREGADPLVYVATQTIEVGVDLDFGTLLTDLAPGSALAQRAGRLNRRGLRSEAPLHLLLPAEEQITEKSARPYAPADLEAAREWLDALAQHPAGLSPQAAQLSPPPQPAPGRLALSHLEEARAHLLARTSERQVVEPDLSFWLRDQLEETPEVSVIARRLPHHDTAAPLPMGQPIDAGEALALMNAVPPQPHEVFPSTLARVSAVLEKCVWTGSAPDRSVLVQRVGEWAWLDLGGQERLRAGDIVCLPAEVKAARHGVLLAEGPEREPLIEVLDPRSSDGRRLPLPEGSSGRRRASFVGRPGALRQGSSAEEYLEAAVLDAAAEILEGGQDLTLPALEDAMIDRGRDQQLRERLHMDALPGEVRTEITCGGPAATGSDSLAWVIIDQIVEPADDAALISELSSDREPVLLVDHQRDVGRRARELAEALGLDPALADVLEAAGLHHDDGKAEPRFQRILEAGTPSAEGRLLAKSSIAAGGARWHRTSDLPPQWRHEQLSAAMLRAEQPDAVDLLIRLVGTSHGHGRGIFHHGSRTLLSPTAAAEVTTAAHDLFDIGRWDSLIDRTHREWGVWGAAYLEALLRAADTTISREGR